MRIHTRTQRASNAALVGAFFTIIAISAPVPAMAEEPAAGVQSSPARSEEETAVSETGRSRWFGLTLGAGVGYVPVAKGIDAWQSLPLPHIEARLGPRVVVGTGGIAVCVVGIPRQGGRSEAPSRIRLTARLLPNLGRYDENLPEEYNGIGDVPMTAEAGFDAAVRLWRGLEMTGMLAVDALDRGHRGSYAATGVRWSGVLPRIGFHCRIGADIVGATTDYMEAYYGVSEERAADTPFAAYDATSGLEAFRGQLTLVAPLAPRVTVVSKTTWTSLIGQAKKSPLVQSTEQATTQLLVAYRF